MRLRVETSTLSIAHYVSAAMVSCLLVMPISPQLTFTTASAQDWDCNDPGNLPQQGMNLCALRDFEAADAELNATWKSIFPKLKAWDADLDDQWKGLPDAVLKAQRSWIVFRDAHCTSEGFKYRGGSIEPLIYHSCRAEQTRQRTKQLQNLLEE